MRDRDLDRESERDRERDLRGKCDIELGNSRYWNESRERADLLWLCLAGLTPLADLGDGDLDVRISTSASFHNGLGEVERPRPEPIVEVV